AQGRLWALGYGALVVLIAGCALVLWRSKPVAGESADGSGGAAAAAVRAPARVGEGRPSLWRGLWAGLAFVPSSLLLGVTSFLTTDLAPMPLLWAIPLGLYLVSFIAVFTPAGEPGPAYRAAVVVFPILAVALVALLTTGVRPPSGGRWVSSPSARGPWVCLPPPAGPNRSGWGCFCPRPPSPRPRWSAMAG